MRVQFLSRDFEVQSEQDGPGARWEVEGLSWVDIGGPDRATLRLRAEVGALRTGLVDLLRCPVVVTDEAGMAVWWGCVWDVRAGLWRASLDDLANRLAVRFERDVPGREWQPETAQTDWADDSYSQALWGVKALRESIGLATDAQAIMVRDALLAERAQVREKVTALVEGVVIEARGWWHTLEWNYYSQAQGQEGHILAGDAVQTLGNSSSFQRVAQSFSISSGPWTACEVWLRCSQWHGPTDNLRVEIRNNSGTAPGTTVHATAERPAAQLPGGPRWVRFAFAVPYQLAVGTTYWLVISRTGAVSSSAYYKVQVDEGLGYAGGVLRTYNGSSWAARSVDADLNFRVGGQRETTEQMGEMLGHATCGQFLTGVVLEAASWVQAALYRGGGRSCRREVEDLLEMGNDSGVRLLARVTAERAVWIYPREEAGAAGLWLRDDGQVRDAYGVLPLHVSPVGRWAIVDAQRPGMPDRVYIRAAEYRPAVGVVARV